MAYPYFNPYYPQPMPDNLMQMRQMQQPQIQPQMPHLQTQMQTSAVWISGGENEANGFMVAPNSQVFIFETNSNTFHIKARDMNGAPIPMKTFSYTEKSIAEEPPKSIPNYATREELNALAAVVNELKEKNKKEEDDDE